jgi:hypothetical protein
VVVIVMAEVEDFLGYHRAAVRQESEGSTENSLRLPVEEVVWVV